MERQRSHSLANAGHAPARVFSPNATRNPGGFPIDQSPGDPFHHFIPPFPTERINHRALPETAQRTCRGEDTLILPAIDRE